MMRGILLSACWAVLVLLIVPQFGRGAPPPNCQDCGCHEADAWQRITWV